MASSAIRTKLALRFTALLALTLAVALPVSAQQVNLGLNIQLSNPVLPGSGGTWEVVATTNVGPSNFGLGLIGFSLDGVGGDAQSLLPTGSVNGSPDINAGFANFAVNGDVIDGEVDVVAFQFPALGGMDVGEFLGVGSVANGSPLFPGQMDGTPVGPNIASLTNLENVPWAAPGGTDFATLFGDPSFSTGVVVATGSFRPGQTPMFDTTTGDELQARVFTALPANAGTQAPQSDAGVAIVTTFTSINLADPLPGDFNTDGFVDAADYTIWRDTLGQMVEAGAGADANLDGEINNADYLIWRGNFGQLPAPVVIAPVTAVPEPSGLFLASLVGVAAGMFPRKKRSIGLVKSNFWKKRYYSEKLLDTPQMPFHNAAK